MMAQGSIIEAKGLEMSKFFINVTRTSYATITFEIEADNVGLAKNMALELAEDSLFTEHSAEYETHEVSSEGKVA